MSANDSDDERAEPQVPESIAAAWGVRERPGKGPKRVLSVRQIVQAATRAALTDGLAAVSMNRVAAEVGTAAMSLYRYVSGKDELLLLMVDSAYGSPPDRPDPNEDWRTGMRRWAEAEYELLVKNPWVVNVPISGPPITPNQVAWMEYGLSCLSRTGLPPDERLAVMLLITGYVRNTATLEVQVTAAERSGRSGTDAFSYGQVLGQLIDTERFPEVSAVLEAGAFDSEEEDSEDWSKGFSFGLDRILDGIGLLIDSRAP